MGTDEPLGRYDNQTIILSIPANQPDLQNAKWLSIWSSKIKVSLAHTLFPADLNIPPSLDTLGQEPEPSLNCEELDAKVPSINDVIPEGKEGVSPKGDKGMAPFLEEVTSPQMTIEMTFIFETLKENLRAVYSN